MVLRQSMLRDEEIIKLIAWDRTYSIERVEGVWIFGSDIDKYITQGTEI